MAYSLPHNIQALQQLTERSQEGVTAPPPPPAPSSREPSRFAAPMDPDQASLRHMLTKPRDSSVDKNTTGEEDDEDGDDEQEVAAAGDDSNGEDAYVAPKATEDVVVRAPAPATNSTGGGGGGGGGTAGPPNAKLQDPSSNPASAATGPTWLSNAMLRQATASAPGSYNQWLQVASDLGAEATLTSEAQQHQQQQQQQQQTSEQGGGSLDVNNTTSGGVKGFLELHAADTSNSGGGGGGGGVGETLTLEQQQQQQQEEEDAAQAAMDSKLWQSARLKADLVTHPLYEQLLSAHISCLRTATPVDQLPKIDAQLAHSAQVAAKYSMLATTDPTSFTKDKDEVNEFMAHYVTLLRSFKEQLQQHVRVHAMEAVVACWELEQSLFTLTGVSPGEGSGATMSEDEDEQADSDSGYFDTAGLDGHDFTGFGPLIPTETERTLMERVRHELKIELKQGYKAKINDVREEILRKRRAGKLPGDTTSVLKSWWHAHSKWPYPSEDDKARLVQETGLELKQINNWFINQRKRNWHSNPSSSTSLKNKRKR